MAGLKIKKGDRVIVLSGKDKGKEGVVQRALPGERKVVVEGVNTAKRHRKARSATEAGGIIDIDKPIDVSNVAVISPKDGKPTRVGYKLGRRQEGPDLQADRRGDHVTDTATDAPSTVPRLKTQATTTRSVTSSRPTSGSATSWRSLASRRSW